MAVQYRIPQLPSQCVFCFPYNIVMYYFNVLKSLDSVGKSTLNKASFFHYFQHNYKMKNHRGLRKSTLTKGDLGALKVESHWSRAVETVTASGNIGQHVIIKFPKQNSLWADLHFNIHCTGTARLGKFVTGCSQQISNHFFFSTPVMKRWRYELW